MILYGSLLAPEIGTVPAWPGLEGLVDSPGGSNTDAEVDARGVLELTFEEVDFAGPEAYFEEVLDSVATLVTTMF
jgi:hypothetical protein